MQVVSILIVFLIYGVLITNELNDFRKLKNKIYRCIERRMPSSKKKLLQTDSDFLFSEVKNLSPHLRRKLKLLVRSHTDDSLPSAIFNGITIMSSILLSLVAITTSIFSLTDGKIKESLIEVAFKLPEIFPHISIFLGGVYIHYITEIKIRDSKKNFLNKFSVAIDEVEIKHSVRTHPFEALYLTRSVSEDHRQC